MLEGVPESLEKRQGPGVGADSRVVIHNVVWGCK